jgi:hypothetical protein
MHGIELEERRSGMAVTLVAGGNYNNRIVECGGLMEDQLGAAACIIEGQGGQQHNNGVQIEHQTFESSGNAGMRRAQEAGSPLRLWLKVSMPNDQLKEQYGLCYTGQWKVRALGFPWPGDAQLTSRTAVPFPASSCLLFTPSSS